MRITNNGLIIISNCLGLSFRSLTLLYHPHSHDHSHKHDEDCSTCGPKVTSTEDVNDVEVPEWKKKALATNADASAAPFGMKWGTEESVSATNASKKVDESHSHSHGHS
eukprot:scaffold1674_cov284-Chaetoceros_neogracile.AAC.9